MRGELAAVGAEGSQTDGEPSYEDTDCGQRSAEDGPGEVAGEEISGGVDDVGQRVESGEDRDPGWSATETSSTIRLHGEDINSIVGTIAILATLAEVTIDSPSDVSNAVTELGQQLLNSVPPAQVSRAD
ncbi:MAG TPA: hypothetical protein ENH15_02485 [Actinobacteria bacterium]|nr:hypothetical protein [Actinomycetota bacterium]